MSPLFVPDPDVLRRKLENPPPLLNRLYRRFQLPGAVIVAAATVNVLDSPSNSNRKDNP